VLSLEKSVNEALRKWSVEERSESSLKVSGVFIFPEDFGGFAGHFPGRPILPAIVQLAAVRHLGQKGLGARLVPVGCQRTKFRGVVSPLEEMEVTVVLHKKGDNWHGKFTMQKGDEPVAGGTLELSCGKEA